MRILLAVDGSSYGDAAVEEVATRPWPAGSEVRIVSAVEPLYVPAAEPWAMPLNYYSEAESAARDRARSAIEGAQSKLRGRGAASLGITTAVLAGSAKKVILEEAERWKADLIMVGSRGHGAWERLLLGSVSNAVALHANCSVEIVRERARFG